MTDRPDQPDEAAGAAAPPTVDPGAPAVPPPSAGEPSATAADAAPPSRAARPRRGADAWWRRAGRGFTGLVVVCAAGAVVVGGAVVLPAPEHAGEGAAVVAVPPRSTTVVCAGPLRLQTDAGTDEDLDYDPAFDPSPAQTVSSLRALTVPRDASAAAEGSLAALSGEPLAVLAGDDVALTADVAGPQASSTLRLDPVAAGTASAAEAGPATVAADGAAALLAATPAGDLRGLAGASCVEPSNDLWLVGGSTVLGTSARLVVHNPAGTPATVQLTVWGGTGEVDVAGVRELLVPPRSERTVLLEGSAAEQRRLAVHLESSGALITATIQDSALDGFTAGGVDLVIPGAPPSMRQTVPGVVLEPSTPADAAASAIRLLAPDGDATVAVRLLGPDGEVELTSGTQLVAGEVFDVSMAGIPTGAYTAVVTSDAPVVAAAMLLRAPRDADGTIAPGPVERAWVAAVLPAAVDVVAVPGGTTDQLLTLAAVDADGVPAAGEVTVLLYSAAGEELVSTTVQVTAEGTASLSLGEAAGGVEVGGVVVRADAGLRPVWAVVLTVPGGAGDGTAEGGDADPEAEGTGGAAPVQLGGVDVETGGQLVTVLTPAGQRAQISTVRVQQAGFGARLGG